MKKTVVLALLLGLILGIGIGRVTSTPTNLKPQAVSLKDSNVQGDKESGSCEQALLLEAINELELLSKDLKEVQEELGRVRKKSDRYDWLVKRWNDHQGFDSTFMMYGEKDDFKPNRYMIEFLGIDGETARALSTLAEQTMTELKNWEMANAVLLEESETKTAYEIPALPVSHKDSFLSEIGSILPPDQAELLVLSYDDRFRSLATKRTVELEILPPDGSIVTQAPEDATHTSPSYDTQSKLQLKIQNFNAEGRSTGTYTHTMPFNAESDHQSATLDRWNHLIVIGHLE